MSLTSEKFEAFNKSVAGYQLIKLINQGGMGDIYLAEDTRLKRQVVIKFFSAMDDEHHHEQAMQEQTLKEAQLLARLNHPNIVQVYDVITFDRFICIVMEYLKGKTLAQYQREHLLSLTEKLTLLADICAGIAHSHNAGVLHCDVKASNIIINDNIPKIIDFGISEASSANEDDTIPATSPLSSYGSLTAMSPEQIRGEPLDVKSDLFSFGLLAFELLVGRHPFGEGSSQEVFQTILEGQAEDARQVIPALPEALATLLNQLLAKSKDNRPEHADQVLRALRAIIVDLTQSAILSQETEVFTPIEVSNDKWFKSSKWVYLAAFFLCLVAGAIGGYFTLSKVKVRNVALLPISIKLSEGVSIDKALTEAAIDEAIRQGIINSKPLNLIPRSEINALTSDLDTEGFSKQVLSRIRMATGADDIVTANLSCDLEQCSLTLEKLGAPNWLVAERNTWPVVTDDFGYLYTSTEQQLEALFPEVKDKYFALSNVENDVFYQHVSLYKEIVISENYTRDGLTQLEQLIERVPDFYANYDLLREVSLGLYIDSQDESELERAKRVLFNAPLDYQNTPLFSYNMAMLYINSKDWGQAESYIEKARASGASLYMINDLKGNLFYQKDDLEKAQEAFTRALKLRESNTVKENLAAVLWWQGDTEESQRLLQEVLLSNPNSYVANQLLADIAMFQGKLDMAIGKYKKAISVQPNGADLSYLSITYSLNGDFEEAYQAAKEAVRLAPENAIYILNLADMEKALGYQQASEADYKKVVALSSSDNFDDLLNVAQAYSQLGQPKEALRALSSAITISPNDKEYLFTAALVYSIIGEYQSALIYIEKSMETGYNSMWFTLPWFSELCEKEEFLSIMQQYNPSFACRAAS